MNSLLKVNASQFYVLNADFHFKLTFAVLPIDFLENSSMLIFALRDARSALS